MAGGRDHEHRVRGLASGRGGRARAASSAVGRRPALDVERILRWADAHRTATGRWPDRRSGPVGGADDETWSAIDTALRRGRRGLPGGSSLARLLAEERGVGGGLNPESPAERLRAWEAEQFPTRRPRRRPAARPRSTIRLTIELILAWADAHHAATGRWPTITSGPIASVPGEKWVNLDAALRLGRRGLPRGTSLTRLALPHSRMLPTAPRRRRWASHSEPALLLAVKLPKVVPSAICPRLSYSSPYL